MIKTILKMLFGPGTDFGAIMQKGAIIVDVRTPDEFAHGHVPRSVNIPLQSLGTQIGELKKRNKPIIAVCRSGARSGAAVSILKKAGIEAYNGGPYTVLGKKIGNYVA